MSLLSWRTRAALLLTVLFAVLATSTVLAHEGRDVGDYNFVVGFINEPAVEGMLNGVSLRVTSLVVEEGDHEHEAEMNMGGEIDLVSHGGVFVSEPELGLGDHFEFTFDHDFEDLTVPFHAHPIETQGRIMIGHDNPAADVVVVEIHESGFKPVMVMIQADTTVRFENHMSEATVVMSGPLGEVEIPADSAPKSAVLSITTLEVEVTHIASSVSQVMPLAEAFGNPGQYKAEFIPTSPGAYNFRFFGEINGTAINESFESSNTTFDEVTPASEIQFPVKLASPRETENAARGALGVANDAGTEAVAASNSASTAILLGIIAVIIGLIGLVLGGLAFVRSGKRA
jgi:plastocyanin